jgi:CheY-like chemotaxis protein
LVESNPNLGSKFTLELPLQELPSLVGLSDKCVQSSKVDESKKLSLPSAINCLLVEDNIINQVVAREMLKSCNARVTVVSNGQEAIDEITLHPTDYQIVFMDVQMPLLDGYAATAKIRAELKLPNLPIIGLTAHAFKEEQDHCREVGMTEVLSKPVKRADLFKIISRYTNMES